MAEKTNPKTWGLISLFLLAVSTGGVRAGGTYSGGTGEPNNPYLISDPCDWLDLMSSSEDWGAHFLLTNNLDLSGQTLALIGTGSIPFTGVFDGNGCVVSNANINLPGTNYVGLYGYLGSGGEIHELGLEDVNITGDWYVGGLVGENLGTISNCSATGLVIGDYFVSGLVGLNYGTISNCYSTGSVTGEELVGGLVGKNSYDGTISNCYASGSVTGDYRVGGLVGSNSNSINNCYATGPVTGDSVGGLVGINQDTISNCYSTGPVSGGLLVGGLVGDTCTSSPVIASFWDIETSGQTSSAGGTGKTTAEMQTESPFTDAGWDFVEVWDIGEEQTYPFLRMYPAGDLNHDGIVNMLDFAILAEHWLEGK